MIDTLLTELAEAGWLLNNCYQVDAALWRVSLRKPFGDGGEWYSSWAEGPTLLEALEDCMMKLNDAEFVEAQEITFGASLPEPKISLSQRLGLRLKVERRI